MFKVNNIFESISGEAGGFPQGTWMTGIRLQACNLRCRWCDTPQAQERDDICYEMELPAILKMVRNKHVLITGGEPLLQKELPLLIKELQEGGHVIQVETNGSYPPLSIPQVHWVIDRKCPSSGMSGNMMPLKALCKKIEEAKTKGGFVYLKWVVFDKKDVDFMLQEMEHFIHWKCNIPCIVSPIDADINKIPEIVERIKESNYFLLDHIIFSFQLHKILKMP